MMPKRYIKVDVLEPWKDRSNKASLIECVVKPLFIHILIQLIKVNVDLCFVVFDKQNDDVKSKY